MYKCRDCGFEFDDPKSYMHDEYGYSYECPCCGSDNFEDMVRCDVCLEYHAQDDLIGGVCRDCIDYISPEEMVKVGDVEPLEVELNSFLATVFSESEINEILLNEFNNMSEDLKQDMKEKFVSENKYELGDWILEAQRKGEI